MVKVSNKVKIDELNCNKSFHRVTSDLGLLNALDYLNKDSHISLCLNNMEDWETKSINYELVVRTDYEKMVSELFIWVYVKKENFDQIKAKYNLLSV